MATVNCPWNSTNFSDIATLWPQWIGLQLALFAVISLSYGHSELAFNLSQFQWYRYPTATVKWHSTCTDFSDIATLWPQRIGLQLAPISVILLPYGHSEFAFNLHRSHIISYLIWYCYHMAAVNWPSPCPSFRDISTLWPQWIGQQSCYTAKIYAVQHTKTKMLKLYMK